MDNVRIVIVDDSPFLISLLRNILVEHGFLVVGVAGTRDEVIDVVNKTRPTLVTMDMTMPGTDGFECTREVHKIDPGIKVIMISSMLDDEIVKEAKENKISACIQKPVDPDELFSTIKRVLDAEELYHFLKEESFDMFKEALANGFTKMTKTSLKFREDLIHKKEFKSNGMTIIVGIIGRFSGRLLIDLSKETAVNIVSALTNNSEPGKDDVMAAMAELINVVSGNACSYVNMKEKSLGLRISPPTVLFGDSVHVSTPDFKTHAAIAETKFGELLLDVGFTRGEERWT